MRRKRHDWLANVIQHNDWKVGAEIGVNVGGTTQFILRENPQLFLFAVDNWGEMENNGITKKNKKRFLIFHHAIRDLKSRVSILEGTSWEMAEKVEDQSLDFIFIDASHQYEHVVKDIKAWTPKLKPEGVIAGHDIHFEGVLKALNEFIPKWVDTSVDHVWYARKKDVLL